MPAEAAIHVEGLRELHRAFSRIDRRLKKDLRETIKEAAEPVRSSAESLSLSEVRNMRKSPLWAETRVGVTQKLVYVVAKKRGTRDPRRQRPNLSELLLARSFEPALERNKEKVVRNFNGLLDAVGREWER